MATLAETQLKLKLTNTEIKKFVDDNRKEPTNTDDRIANLKKRFLSPYDKKYLLGTIINLINGNSKTFWIIHSLM